MGNETHSEGNFRLSKNFRKIVKFSQKQTNRISLVKKNLTKKTIGDDIFLGSFLDLNWSIQNVLLQTAFIFFYYKTVTT
jgi:hypothetical protein